MRVLAAGLMVLAGVAGCSSAPPADTDPVAWTKVDLAAGDEPVLVGRAGDDLLLGLRRPGAKVVPRLQLRTAAGGVTEVPLRPGSPYAFEATWHSVAVDGDRLLALGGAPGGAHANTRWTVWTGTTAGLTERPQSFNTFGGYGAGELLDAVTTTAGQALVGSWGGGDQSGLDAAVWLADGSHWIRQSPAGTVLQSTGGLLVGPRAGTAAGAGVVLVGSQVRLSADAVRQQAAVWRSTRLNAGWSRLELPAAGERSEAYSVRCDGTECVVAGQVDGRLALWTVTGARAARVTGLPEVAVQDKDELPAPIDLDGRTVQVVAADGRVQVLVGHGADWTAHDAAGSGGAAGPGGVVTGAVVAGGNLYLLAGPPGQPATLWRSDLTALR